MAMALSGARGDTATEMAGVLHHQLDPARMDAANANILTILKGYDEPTMPDPFRSGARISLAGILRIANALMVTQSGYEYDAVSDGYLRQLKHGYAAEVLHGAGLDEVDNWVRRKTNGKIERILDQLGSLTGLVVVNAIYFRQDWWKRESKFCRCPIASVATGR